MQTYVNPYGGLPGAGSRWYKCNFHVHDVSPEDPGSFASILKKYKAAGYDIIVNSGQKDFYDTRGAAAEAGITTYKGQEYVEKDGILLIGTDRFISGTPQQAVDACRAAGGFSVACHPGIAPWLLAEGGVFLTPADIAALKGLTGVEILNGCIPLVSMGGGILGKAIEVGVWDGMLSQGVLVWGFGNDDYHSPHEINTAWTEIFARSDRYEDVRAAVSQGCLCASNGLRLKRFDFEGGVLTVWADYPIFLENPGYIEEYPSFHDDIDYKFVGASGKVLSRQSGTAVSLKIGGDEPYVRVEARGADGASLWTQPLYRADAFKSN